MMPVQLLDALYEGRLRAENLDRSGQFLDDQLFPALRNVANLLFFRPPKLDTHDSTKGRVAERLSIQQHTVGKSRKIMLQYMPKQFLSRLPRLQQDIPAKIGSASSAGYLHE